MQDIVLYEKILSGHHLSYLRIYTSAFVDIGCKVTILASDVDKVSEYFAERTEFSQKIQVLPIKARKVFSFESEKEELGLLKDLLRSYSAFMNFYEIRESLKFNKLGNQQLVFIMWFDSFISKYLVPFFLLPFFPYKFCGLWFHPCHIKFLGDRQRRYRDLHYCAPILRAKNLKLLGVFDDLIADRLKDRLAGGAFYRLPDISESHSPDYSADIVNQIKERAGGRKIVSLVGSLDSRKNLMAFVKAAIKCDGEAFFVCAGKFHKGGFIQEDLDFLWHAVSENQDKLFFHDKHIESDNVFDTLIQMSTVIVAVYKNFTSSSNMISKAALYEKNIVVANEHLMSEIVEKYGMGLCVESGDPEALAEAIRFILKNKDIQRGCFSEYLADHSYENLKKYLQMAVSSP